LSNQKRKENNIIVPNVYTTSSAGFPPPIKTDPNIKKKMTLKNTVKKKILIYFDIKSS
jgi:hypothetical protein